MPRLLANQQFASPQSKDSSQFYDYGHRSRSAEFASTELPEIVPRQIKEAVRILPLMKCSLMGLWDKVEDKYAVI
ncbi:hypothetical protein NC652_032079 [Populus alba x Populus x berolinensis]|nr:hypothetical protein NC652_032079 [Populus alba x Populus x berolinensis]